MGQVLYKYKRLASDTKTTFEKIQIDIAYVPITNCEGPPHKQKEVSHSKVVEIQYSLVHLCVSSSRPALEGSGPSEVEDMVERFETKTRREGKES